MTNQDELRVTNDKVADAKTYAELLTESKRNEDLYKLVSVALASYTDGMKSALRCQNAAQVTT